MNAAMVSQWLAQGKLTSEQILGFLDLYTGIDREFAEARALLGTKPEVLAKFETALFG
ncbi:MAG: hypothetical protein IPP91_18500 [Betaproteobacteria bacterium]|nr:hypothetical protein [Betaproteobacteria bacterium]